MRKILGIILSILGVLLFLGGSVYHYGLRDTIIALAITAIIIGWIYLCLHLLIKND